MPHPNRVDPFGNIQAVPERGTMFGNRGGCLHTPDQQLHGRPWTNERWICCVLEFKGRRRRLMQPGLYTELFFLDEATAFAAGHRPCMECRRPDAKRFIAAWELAHPGSAPVHSISEIDRRAHAERVDTRTHAQRSTRATLGALPDGVIVALDAAPSTPRLLWRGRLLRWTFAGYTEAAARSNRTEVTLLTPPSFARVFAHGFEPQIHQSAL